MPEPPGRSVACAWTPFWTRPPGGPTQPTNVLTPTPHPGTVQSAAKKLCSEAFERGSEDNISALVVLLQPYLA